MIMIVMTLQRPKNLSIKREYPTMNFIKPKKNAMLKNSNTHWVMETEITIPLSLKKVVICFQIYQVKPTAKRLCMIFFNCKLLVTQFSITNYLPKPNLLRKTVFLIYLCIIFTVPFPFPVLILTNQFFNSIILFFYSFEAKVKKNSFKQVGSNDKVNFQ